VALIPVVTVEFEPDLGSLDDAVSFQNASAPPGGDEYENDGSVQLMVNVATAPREITIAAVRECDFGDLHVITKTLETAGGYIIPPLPPHFFNTNGRVKVTVDDEAGVSYVAIRSRDAKR
jgi:hypothetical protein